MSDLLDEKTKPIKIIVRRGVVEGIKNLPAGLEFQIVDLDERNEDVAQRQDLVDNAIFEMLREVSIAEIVWDIEVIGAVRDTVINVLEEKYGIKEDVLYPGFEDEITKE